MPENIRGILVYELMCGIRARTVFVKRAPVHGNVLLSSSGYFTEGKGPVLSVF